MYRQDGLRHIGYKFFDFILTQDNQLMKKNSFIRTGAKELAVLRVLIESAGKLVGKNELLDQVWGTTIVSEESLARCIYVLRKTFQQDRQNVYIQTIYSKGYIFVAEAKKLTDSNNEVAPEQTPVLYQGILESLFGKNISYVEISGQQHIKVSLDIVIPVSISTEKSH